MARSRDRDLHLPVSLACSDRRRPAQSRRRALGPSSRPGPLTLRLPERPRPEASASEAALAGGELTRAWPGLEAEDLLHLVPDREHQEQCEPDEDDEGGGETESGARLLALAPNARVSPSTVIVVGTVDRAGVDRRVVGRGDETATLLGPPAILCLREDVRRWFEPYFRGVVRHGRASKPAREPAR